MLPLLHLLKWKGSHRGNIQSCSMLVDFNQIHIRNLFLFCFGLGLAKQMFGENIECQHNKHDIEKKVLEMKCFINYTRTTFMDETLIHDFYQWIPVILLLLAFSFHFPAVFGSNGWVITLLK